MDQRKPPREPVRPKGYRLGFDHALLPQGWRENVVVEVSGLGVVESVEIGVDGFARVCSDRGDCHWTHGTALPGMANVHSHAHQRLMAGLAERSGPGEDTFWTWREVMYRFASRLSPGQLEVVAAQAYVEMLEAGFTAVGEFQYLHNQVDGTPYVEPAEMSLRCLEAARSVGIGITLLPALYSQGGFDGRALKGGQERFATSVDSVLSILDSIEGAVGAGSQSNLLKERVGVAPHSLRAVAGSELIELVATVSNREGARIPIHLHLAEQIAEVDDCLAHTGMRPAAWLLEHMAEAGHPVNQQWCLIHATHLDDDEVRRLAESGAVVGLCPTTEANLGDGTFRASEYLAARAARAARASERGMAGRLAIGTDSQVRISVAEDLRQIETSQRLRDGQRNVLAGAAETSTGRTLYERGVAGGAQALNQPIGAIEAGRRADLVVLDSSHPRLLGRQGDGLLDSWIFAGDNSCVAKVYVGGACVVSGGRHRKSEEVVDRFKNVLAQLASE